MTINLEIAIFISFLILNLIIGLIYGKQTKNINDYALGQRNFSTTALVSTIVATFITGSSFFITLAKTYTDGLPYIIASCCYCLQFLITGFFLIPRMGEFMGSLSTAEVMGNLYGNRVRLITAISGILWNVGGIAVQLKVFGNIFNYFLGVPGTYAIILGSSIVILYSAFGGIRAVTYTDVLQFFTFGFVIPFLGVIIWSKFQADGLSLTGGLQSPLFDYHTIFTFDNPDLLNTILLMLYFSIPCLGPIHFQRISMGRNIGQAKKAFLISALLFLVIKLAMAWIPFLVLNINPDLESTQVMNYIISNYTYPGLKVLIMIGIAAMAMSSADSFINGSAVLFGYDLKEVFNIKMEYDHLILSKLFAVVLGIFALYLALSTNDLLAMVMTSASLYMPIVSVPLIFSVLGFRSTEKTVLIAMSMGFITVVVWHLLNIQANVVIPGMVINLIFLLGSHYVLKQSGGWINTKSVTHSSQLSTTTPTSTSTSTSISTSAPISFKETIAKLKKLIRATRNFSFIRLCKEHSPTDEFTYMGFGIYCIIYTIITMYTTTQVSLLEDDGKTISIIYQIMMITGTVIAMYPIWPNSIKRTSIIQIWWNIAVFYMLIFFSSFFILLNGFNRLQAVVFAVNIIIATVITDWRRALVMISVGFYLSTKFYKYYIRIEALDINISSPEFILFYSFIIISTALLIFIKPQQEEQKQTDKKLSYLSNRLETQDTEIARLQAVSQKILNNINHELRLPIGNVLNFSEMLRESLEKYNKKQLKVLLDEVYKSSNRLSSMILNMLDLVMLDIKKINLQKRIINLSELVEDRIAVCKKIHLEDKELTFSINIEPNVMALVDPNYIRQTIDNLIINAIKYSEEGTITIALRVTEENKNENEKRLKFTITDKGIGIPPTDIYRIFEPFQVSSKTYTPASGRGVGLTLCKSAVEAHGGNIHVKSDGIKGASFSFTL